MTKFAIQVIFLQNALVEYIGVHSDTNKHFPFPQEKWSNLKTRDIA